MVIQNNPSLDLNITKIAITHYRVRSRHGFFLRNQKTTINCPDTPDFPQLNHDRELPLPEKVTSPSSVTSKPRLKPIPKKVSLILKIENDLSKPKVMKAQSMSPLLSRNSSIKRTALEYLDSDEG